MRFIINSIGFHVLMLLLFTIIYYNLPHGHLVNQNSEQNVQLLDLFNLSTTIQAGVGMSSIIPTTALAQSIIIFQQLMLIVGNVSILHYLLYYL